MLYARATLFWRPFITNLTIFILHAFRRLECFQAIAVRDLFGGDEVSNNTYYIFY